VATETLHRAVGDLREMLVELHPRELTGDNLADLVATSAIRACPDQEVAVSAQVQRPVPGAGRPATTARTGWRATSSSRPCTSDTELSDESTTGRVHDRGNSGR
jgi:hypothetical protein